MIEGSEVARLLDQIREEYEAAMLGCSGLSHGTSRHAFITARMENMGKLEQELEKHVGKSSIALVISAIDKVNQASL